MISSLMQDLKISSFSSLLRAYCETDPDHGVYIDGGAGNGVTCKEMLDAAGSTCRTIHAFEPNVNNISLFKITDPRVTLHGKALSNFDGPGLFNIPAPVDPALPSPIGRNYSSVGSLIQASSAPASHKSDIADVNVCSINKLLPNLKPSFVKLDLQGGELPALKGMSNMLASIKWMWIEFSNQPGLYDFLVANDFYLFDTEYLFVGEPNQFHLEEFEITRSGRNTLRKQIFFGVRKNPWEPYIDRFDFMMRRRRMIQTDLICINNRHRPLFDEAFERMMRQRTLMRD